MVFFSFVLIVLADQFTKAWVLRNLSLHESIPVVKGLFHITLVKNAGAAFGVLPYQRTLFIVVALAVLVILLYFFNRTELKYGWQKFVLGCGMGGIVGNLIDRLRFGYVVDFLDFRIWPVFNIADSALVVSVAFLIIFFIFKGE